MINAGFKAKTQTAWRAGVAGFIPHRDTTLRCLHSWYKVVSLVAKRS